MHSPAVLADEVRLIGGEIDDVEDGVESHLDVDVTEDPDREESLGTGFLYGFNLATIDRRLANYRSYAECGVRDPRTSTESQKSYQDVLRLINNLHARVDQLLSQFGLERRESTGLGDPMQR